MTGVAGQNTALCALDTGRNSACPRYGSFKFFLLPPLIPSASQTLLTGAAIKNTALYAVCFGYWQELCLSCFCTNTKQVPPSPISFASQTLMAGIASQNTALLLYILAGILPFKFLVHSSSFFPSNCFSKSDFNDWSSQSEYRILPVQFLVLSDSFPPPPLIPLASQT